MQTTSIESLLLQKHTLERTSNLITLNEEKCIDMKYNNRILSSFIQNPRFFNLQIPESNINYRDGFIFSLLWRKKSMKNEIWNFIVRYIDLHFDVVDDESEEKLHIYLATTSPYRLMPIYHLDPQFSFFLPRKSRPLR